MTPVEKFHSIEDFRLNAKRRLPRAVFDFIDGGAEDEITLSGNREAFARRRIVPRVLVDVSQPDFSTHLFGERYAAPLVIAPMGSCALVRPGADFDIARAAANHGIPYCLSTMSTASMEEMAQTTDGQLWFQLYVLKDHEFNESLVNRASDLGYSALVVTVDLPAGGKREKDLKAGISIPLRPSPRTIFESALHPIWALRQLKGGLPKFHNVEGYLSDKGAGMTIAARAGQNLDAGFNWEDMQRLREIWKGPLIAKGVLHADDAERFAKLGGDAIWISNHGGRQLDGAISSADALEVMAGHAGLKLPLILDSGIRRGSDLLKGRALGMTTAAIGRAALFGAVEGERGVDRALDILLDELKLAMKLSGQNRFSDVTADLLADQHV